MIHLRDPKFWASVSAWMVVVAIVILWPAGIYKNWSISEIGTIIGAIAGPFAGLAGFLYIYVNFIHQQEQFERQSFESILLRLLDRLKLDSKETFPTDLNKGETPLLKKFESQYGEKFLYYNISDGNEMQQGEKEYKLEILGNLYYYAFQDSIRSVLALYKLFVGVLVYIDESQISNRDNYYNLLFSQLTQAEIRVFFYGYFHDGFELSEHEKKLIRNFFLRYNGRDLIYQRDIKLFQD